MTYKTALILCLGCFAASASAQLNPTGPFVGSSSEDFESFPNYNVTGGQDTMVVMGGAATFSSNPVGSNQVWIYSPANSAAWGLGGNGSATVHGGVNGLGVYNNQSAVNATLTFANPVSAFGGYFADVDYAPVSLTFFDGLGNQLGTSQSVEHGSNSMDWYGWSSSAGIKTVLFTGGVAPVMDDLQAQAVPEPASMVVMGLGVVGLLRKRRSA